MEGFDWEFSPESEDTPEIEDKPEDEVLGKYGVQVRQV